MIVLITGTPGSGKSLFAVSKILQLKKEFPNRKIYADIDNLQIDDVLPSPVDWRETEQNSIIFYDEAQQHERYRVGYGNNRDEIVQGLQIARHSGHDIYFITQSPRFLNGFVTDLVGEHYHLHRPFGAKLASVYYWRGCRKQPQSLTSQELAENTFLFKYPKNLFDYYKSATSHSVKFKIPRKFFILLAVFLILVFLAIKFFNTSDTQKFIKPSTYSSKSFDNTKANSNLSSLGSSNSNNNANASVVEVNFIYDYQKPFMNNYTEHKYQPVELPITTAPLNFGNSTG